MAREKMITRTIDYTRATVLCMDTETCEVSRETLVITGKETDCEALLAPLQHKYQTDTFKLVKVEDCETFEKLYGMSENFFMENAIELDPETRKPL